jgi:hypothetical protein
MGTSLRVSLRGRLTLIKWNRAFFCQFVSPGLPKEIQMLTLRRLISPTGRIVLLATIAGLVLTASETRLLAAPGAPVSKGVLVAPASKDVTDFSAARRHRYYRRGGNAAAGAAFMGMAFGMIAGAIAEQQRRDYYQNYYYGYGPGPYYGPGYYGGPYYGRRYYYPPY